MSSTTGPRPSTIFNRFSFEFDGIDDYINCGNGASLQITGALTISAWVKTTDTNYIGIYGKGNSVALSDVYFRMQNTGVIRVFLNNTSINVTGTTAINDGNWHHIMFVYVPSTSMTIYVDGSQDVQNTTSIPSAINNNYSSVYIGQFQFWDGNIDEVAVWNSDQSGAVTTIYNGGKPNDISSLSPISWWRMGDEATYDGSNWSLPDSKSVFSRKSIELDGSDDYVQVANSPSLNITSALSVSMWFKTTSSAVMYPITQGSGSEIKFFVQLYAPIDRIRLQIYDGSSVTTIVDNTQVFDDGQWHNLTFTTDALTTTDGVKVYFDGTLLTNKGTLSNSGIRSITTALYIGQIPNTARFEGNIDEVAIFNSELSASDVTSIYNSGVPNDISSFSPVSWWRCGDGDTSPTLTDNGSGGNDGTMTNFSTFSIEAPTLNPGTSTNMTEDSRKIATPNF